MEEKYIELLIDKCTNLKENKILFLSYNKEIKPFIDKLIKYVKSIGVNDIYIEEEDKYLIHDFLTKATLKDIDNSPYFNKQIWDEYVNKKASFLIFETEIPHLMDDIEPKKLGYASKRKRNTKPLYISMQEKCQIPWCIAAYPGLEWAKDIFKDNPNAYDKLKNQLFSICLLDKQNPLEEWDKVLNKNFKIMDKLNSLNLYKLHYSNSLGTNLEIYLPDNYLYSSAKDSIVIANMPSYEVFTSPIYNKTKGIVYSSKPLIYNGGFINNFWLKFENGKVIDYDAKTGKEILKEIIETDQYSCYLGEAALVEKDSPIAKLNITFGTTLIDENASCHIALGAGFPECIKDGFQMSEEKLRENGINSSKQHVDFMIGTDDLNIVGYTKDNRKINIFTDGKFSSDIVGKLHEELKHKTN